MAQVQAIPQSIQSQGLPEVLERVLDKGLVIAGDIKIKLCDIELLSIQIRLLVCSVDKARELGMTWWWEPTAAPQPAVPPPHAQPNHMPAPAARTANLADQDLKFQQAMQAISNVPAPPHSSRFPRAEREEYTH